MRQAFKTFREKVLPRSLYARSMMILVLPVFLMQLIVAYVFIERHWESMSDRLVFALSGEIRMLAAQIKSADDAKEIDRLIEEASSNLDLVISIGNFAEEKKARAAEDHLKSFGVHRKLNESLAARLEDPFVVLSKPEDRWFEVIVTAGEGKDIRFLCYNRRLTSSTTYIFILWLLGTSIILMAVAILFMRNQIRPIRRLAIAAERLGKGQDVAHLKIEGAREVRQAARAFLEMRDRIRRQLEQRTTMLAGVSHDLKTPITRIKLQLAMMPDNAENKNLRQDLEEMERMLEGYLDFARGEGEEHSGWIDLASILERMAANARRQGVAVTIDAATNLSLRARPLALERALGNILQNACKYGKGNVWITARQDQRGLTVEIEDDGAGIPPEKREEVFKPFFRLEKSRNQKTGGVGLGLSIAQDIIHAHGGEIVLGESVRGGLRVTVLLPV